MSKGNQPEIKLRGGVSRQFMDGYCDDSMIGETTWKTELKREDCTPTSHDVLYQGVAEILIAPDFVTHRNITHVLVQRDLIVFALELQEEVNLCHLIVRKTDQPTIFVVLGRPDFLLSENSTTTKEHWFRSLL